MFSTNTVWNVTFMLGVSMMREFVMSQQERNKVRRDLHVGVELSREVSSSLVSFHPPFFKLEKSDVLSARAKSRFLQLLKEEVDYAYSIGIKMALESFCYPPFIFNGLSDFMHFVSDFPSTKLGILLEVGHLYQARFNLDEAIQTFGDRIFDVHVHDATLHEDYKKATHLPIGSGNIDFLGVMNSLRKVKYDGWLTLEIHGDEGKILESKKLLENLIGS
jgi:sugar phosphate isomerase/epimerase